MFALSTFLFFAPPTAAPADDPTRIESPVEGTSVAEGPPSSEVTNANQWQFQLALGYTYGVYARKGNRGFNRGAVGPAFRGDFAAWHLRWHDHLVWGGGPSLAYSYHPEGMHYVSAGGDLVLGGGKRGRAVGMGFASLGFGQAREARNVFLEVGEFPIMRPTFGLVGQFWVSERVSLGPRVQWEWIMSLPEPGFDDHRQGGLTFQLAANFHLRARER